MHRAPTFLILEMISHHFQKIKKAGAARAHRARVLWANSALVHGRDSAHDARAARLAPIPIRLFVHIGSKI